MQRIAKTASAITTSEVVSTSDSESESSINSSTHYGSGDEGIEISTGTANSTGNTSAPHAISCGFTAPVQAIVGTFCAATTVAGGIMLIYGGMGNSNFLGDQHDLYRALIGAGGAMLGIGSLVAMSSMLKRPDTAGQLPVVSV